MWQRTMLDDVKDYIAKGYYDEAGVALGMILNEMIEEHDPEAARSGSYREALLEGLEGELT